MPPRPRRRGHPRPARPVDRQPPLGARQRRARAVHRRGAGAALDLGRRRGDRQGRRRGPRRARPRRPRGAVPAVAPVDRVLRADRLPVDDRRADHRRGGPARCHRGLLEAARRVHRDGCRPDRRARQPGGDRDHQCAADRRARPLPGPARRDRRGRADPARDRRSRERHARPGRDPPVGHRRGGPPAPGERRHDRPDRRQGDGRSLVEPAGRGAHARQRGPAGRRRDRRGGGRLRDGHPDEGDGLDGRLPDRPALRAHRGPRRLRPRIRDPLGAGRTTHPSRRCLRGRQRLRRPGRRLRRDRRGTAGRPGGPGRHRHRQRAAHRGAAALALGDRPAGRFGADTARDRGPRVGHPRAGRGPPADHRGGRPPPRIGRRPHRPVRPGDGHTALVVRGRRCDVEDAGLGQARRPQAGPGGRRHGLRRAARGPHHRLPGRRALRPHEGDRLVHQADAHPRGDVDAADGRGRADRHDLGRLAQRRPLRRGGPRGADRARDAGVGRDPQRPADGAARHVAGGHRAARRGGARPARDRRPDHRDPRAGRPAPARRRRGTAPAARRRRDDRPVRPGDPDARMGLRRRHPGGPARSGQARPRCTSGRERPGRRWPSGA